MTLSGIRACDQSDRVGRRRAAVLNLRDAARRGRRRSRRPILQRSDPCPRSRARRLAIATRESALALWQAEHIRALLAALYPASEVGLLGVTTQGDRILDQPLADIGGKGLFIKELEVAMAEGRADLAVHSLKDVPMDMPEGFALAAITAREDPRDALRVQPLPRPRAAAGRRARRHVEPAPRSAAARARSAALDRAAARQRQHAAAQARRGQLRRDHPRGGGPEAAGLRRADRVAARSRGEPSRRRAGRARARVPRRARRRDRRARAARRSRDDARDDARSARSRARFPGSCHTPLAGARGASCTASCGCADCSRAATAPR